MQCNYFIFNKLKLSQIWNRKKGYEYFCKALQIYISLYFGSLENIMHSIL